MFKRTKVCSGLMLAFGGTLALTTPLAFGQAQAQLERVEITGSSIRRIDAESALPVVVLKREEIVRSGATSITDLLNKMPTMQGQTVESGQVGPESFGFAGVSIHNIGETRTLVLLNGHRLAQFGGQTLTGSAAAVDLNSIPVSAIERIEILSDGASALYGADAIAGVVNFITRRDITEGDITLGYSSPRDGAREKRISATKGFGSINEDGYNVTLTFSHDERTKLNSTSRSFANTGRVFFNADGKSYRFQQFSTRAIPANVQDDAGNLISPYQKVNGTCPPNTFRVIDGTDDYCGFDFVSTLEIYPERKRDNFFGTFSKKLGDHELFVDVLASKSTATSRIAPVPGEITISAGSALHDKYLLPLGITGDSIASYRVSDLGLRTNRDIAKFYDVALGSKGSWAGWDYKVTLTQSESDVKANINRYPGALALRNLTTGGLLDPFVLPGQQTPAALAAINATNYNGYFNGGVAKLDTVQIGGSREIFKLPAGPVLLGTGVNFNREVFTSKPSLFAQGLLADPVAGTLCDPTGANPALECDQRFGDASAEPPYTASRRSYGIFGELIIPALKTLEFGVAARYDHYSDFGSAYTGKGSFRWTPTKTLLVRGSLGTGFHAPTVPQVNAAQRSFGVTNDNYTCTPELQAQATAQGAQCRPGNVQYDQLAGGNKNLSPEKSRQGTIGLAFEPTPNIAASVDLWHVEIRDAFGQVTEQRVFGNPAQFPGNWTSFRDVGTGVNYLAFLANNVNLGKQFSTGLDFDITARAKTGWGDLASQFNLTYMIREQQQIEVGGPYFSAIGNNAELGTVTFRWQGKWQTSLKTGNWTNTIGLNFKSGYRDFETEVEVLDAAGNVTGTENIRLNVPTYYTMDLQTQWTPIKNFAITLGALNVFNRKPPFSLSIGGLNQGQQFGYDDRYYDSRGRTLYANASYKF